MGIRHTIRAIAGNADTAGGIDPCPTLEFFAEQRAAWKSEMIKLSALLTDIADNGPRYDDGKSKKLPGTDGLFEFRSSPCGLRVFWFWDDGGLIICTHGCVKDSQKTPASEIERAQKKMRDYFEAKRTGALQHGHQKRRNG